MNTNDKTLLLFDEPGTNKTISIVVEEKEIVAKTKEFLKKIAEKYKNAKINVYSPVGVVLKTADDEENFAVAYEREKFIIVSHKGTNESAKLYGNWQEAITYVQRILNGAGKKSQFVLAEYKFANK